MITPEERAELMSEITEHILLVLPAVISHLIQNVITLKELSTKFYETHKDLIQHKQLVGTMIEQLEFKYPGKNMEEILKLAAIEVRNVLQQQKSLNDIPRSSVEQLERTLGRL